MKLTVIVGIALAAGGAVGQDGTESKPGAGKEHAWLRALAGEWESEFEACGGEGQHAIKFKGKERVKAVGDYWILLDNEGMGEAAAFKGVWTLGFDEKKGRFVGTWIDSSTSRMWHYTGTLDAASTTLTMETEGPDPMNPSVTVKFRESIELKGADRKVLASRIDRGGKWVTFVTGDYRRKK